ncbi:MAG: cyclic nucleotide-binding domain-containing protein [Chloroflexi bacterium]|nr:cyclic nucleotide-binding domain-containing protein [Chloroflexota bacterium]
MGVLASSFLLIPMAIGAVASTEPAHGALKVTAESAFGSVLLGLVAASSLMIGAALGIYLKAPKRVVAAVMAFGAGALIESLAIELAFGGAEALIAEERLSPFTGWLWVASGFLIGGSVYSAATIALDNVGAAARKASSLRNFVRRARREQATTMLIKLSSSDLFRSLPAADLVRLIPHADTRRLKAGETIFKPGEISDGVYLIEKGHVEFKPEGAGGMDGTYGEGHCFGELELLTNENRQELAVTVDEVQLLFIPREDFSVVMEASPVLRDAVSELVKVHTHGTFSIEHHLRQETRDFNQKEWLAEGVAAVAMPSHEEAAHHAKGEHGKGEDGEHGGGSPLAIFAGALLDGVPESIVLGAAFTSFATFNPTFLVAVFMSNLPEAMASSAQMKRIGYTPARIFGLWGSLVVASAVAALIGNMFLATASEQWITFVEAFAGGGIMAMLAQTMMPEAYEEGGTLVGLATIAGFLAALFFTALELAH